MVASPNAVFRTTFAVLRPTPGSASKASRVLGTSPPCCVTNAWHVAMMFFALLLNRPMVLMKGVRPATPNASMAAGVWAARNSAGVALLTPLSVACADRITAINSSNGDR